MNLSILGTPVLLDCGTYLYVGAGEWRRYFRGTAAHNTIQIDKLDQATQTGPFQWNRHVQGRLLAANRTPGGYQLAGEHNGYRRRGVKHHRQVEWNKTKSTWLITDNVKGRGRHNIALFFHLGTCEVEKGNSVVCKYTDFSLHFRFEDNAGLELEIISATDESQQNRHSPKFGKLETHSVLKLSGRVKCPVRIKTWIEIDA